MAAVTSLERLSISPNGSVGVEGFWLLPGALHSTVAVRFEPLEPGGMQRITIYAFRQPLSERYSNFCKRLDAAISRAKGGSHAPA
ncbi:hypothetical protein [Brucella sp. 22210]|uniref:hypothetical protein n=1 Tax=Brucella sp. 22210 TaxID=3453892 RepID=UPI003F851CE2